MPFSDPEESAEEELSEEWLERLAGARSSKPTFYAEWRNQSRGLERALQSVRSISAALCATTHGPEALCAEVIDAAAQHFQARWAAISFVPGRISEDLPRLIARSPAGTGPTRWSELPPQLKAVAEAVLAGGDVVHPPTSSPTRTRTGVGVPLRQRDVIAGALVVLPADDVPLSRSDLSIVETLANHAGIALENAFLFEERERHGLELEARNRQLRKARVRLSESRRQELLAKERERIARELHDRVAQYVLSIGMNLKWCRVHAPESSPLVDRLVITQDLARSALGQIRATIEELSPNPDPRATGGLGPALGELSQEFSHTTSLTVTFEDRGGLATLSPNAQWTLFHVAQEALFNVAKHASAQRAWVAASCTESDVCLEVADDGIGDPVLLDRRLTDAEHGHRIGASLGLTSMVTRAAELGGTIRAYPREGGGLLIRLQAPHPKETR
ncbi:MAG: GAF domain-containing sensor histidine kinase [Actinoallomurus sp.]